MNELRDELRSLADRVDLPPTTAAEGAWAMARGRVRRRRAAAAAGVAAAAVVAAVGLQAMTSGPDEIQPAPVPPTRDSLLDVASEPVAGERLDPLLGQALPERLEDREVVPLAKEPLDGPAAYAVGVGKREVLVLGSDGRYRSIIGLDVIVNGGHPLRSGSLSPDATMLALPQPGRLLVIDLLDASTAPVDAGGISTTDVAWVDEDTVAVYAGRLVRTVDVPADLSDGDAVTAMRATVSDPVGGNLPVTGSGTIAWQPEVPGLVVDGEEVPVPSLRPATSLSGPVPVAGEGWVAVAGEPIEESDLPRGVAVLDTATGRPRAFLPMDALDFFDETSEGSIRTIDYSPPSVAPLAVDGDTTVVVGMQTVYGVLVLRWDWAADELTGLVAEEDTSEAPGNTAISWGAGLP
ncbi:hypothetical protein [Nocardioides sp.]|uniref:hypothetical protein n=1 Tax=Nocardioides sp. TaxID=35761 RepID=UPI002608722E|nr:hypothetical protein [Nocardioides sp.]